MNWIVIAFSAAILALVGFMILAYLVSNQKIRPPFKRPAEIIVYVVYAAFFVLIIGVSAIAGINYYFTDSGWCPRTGEVTVYFKADSWVQGELKTCFSSEKDAKSELVSLVCDADTDQSHDLSVRLWGPITTERPKIWKCERESESLTCKLQ